MQIRRYEPRDLTATVDLWRRTWHTTFPTLSHPWSDEAWTERFQDDLLTETTVWVAETDVQIVGFMALDVPNGHLRQMWVDPNCHGQGIGSALLDLAKAQCPNGLTLHTLQQNQHARAFYERRGFVAGETGVNEVNGQPNILYAWRPMSSEA